MTTKAPQRSDADVAGRRDGPKRKQNANEEGQSRKRLQVRSPPTIRETAEEVQDRSYTGNVLVEDVAAVTQELPPVGELVDAVAPLVMKQEHGEQLPATPASSFSGTAYSNAVSTQDSSRFTGGAERGLSAKVLELLRINLAEANARVKQSQRERKSARRQLEEWDRSG